MRAQAGSSVGAGPQPEPVFCCPSLPQDFHSHLTRSEVVGYLGGRWDINSQSGYPGPGGRGRWGTGVTGSQLPLPTVLTVLRAFPCRSRLGDAETAAAIEEEVRGYLGGGILGRVGKGHSCPGDCPVAGSVITQQPCR